MKAGDRFGALTLVKMASISKDKDRFKQIWWCVCDCGNSVIKAPYHLKKAMARGYRPHCGCMRVNAGDRWKPTQIKRLYDHGDKVPSSVLHLPVNKVICGRW